MKSKGCLIYKIISVILLVAVMCVIFYLSHQDSSESSETSGFVTGVITAVFGEGVPEELVRTLAHFLEFAALGFLVFNCLYAFTNERKFILSVALSWGYAWTDEIHQIFVDGRAFQLVDLAVDLGGIILGALIIYAIVSAVKKREKQLTVASQL